MEDFDRVVGGEYLKAMHINDSKSALGSGLDRCKPSHCSALLGGLLH